MSRIRYRYNPSTCRYEPFFIKGKRLFSRVLVFLTVSLLIAAAGYYWATQHVETYDEMVLRRKNQNLKTEWSVLHKRIGQSHRELAALIEKDDHNYRVILDSNPLSPSIRSAGIGGSEKFNLKAVQDYPMIAMDYVSMENLKHQLEVEVQSYHEIENILNDKLIAWATRPAIQPVNNTQLERLHLTYGLRPHPIFKVLLDHKGLDFAAPTGTPVYATGDGKISMAYFSGSYGNVIYVDHGYDFETRYAHLAQFAVKPGEHVKRGQIIGYVGNTGNSVSAHLHYEVLVIGQHVNPINFFQRDLNNKEYQKLIEAGSKNSISLD